jgi:putative endonuclease
VIDCNATFQGGELDIICTKNGLSRFVEVKYRESTLFGYPEEAMTPKKVKTLLRSIELYCLKHNVDPDTARLDFLGILKLPNGEYEYRLIEDVN